MNLKKTLISLFVIGCILLAFGWWKVSNRIVEIDTGTGTTAITGALVCDTTEKVIIGNVIITPDRSPSDGPKSVAIIASENYKIGTGIDGYNFGGVYSGTMKLYEKPTDECQGRCVPGPLYCAKYVDFMNGIFTSSGVDASEEYTVNLSDPQPSLPFDLNTGDVINLRVLSPSEKTVIRVSQIVFPDGTMDGPFSSDTTFIAAQKGQHVFIIKPNMMASQEVYTGSVIVIVSLKANN